MLNLNLEVVCPKCGLGSNLKTFSNDELMEFLRLSAKFGPRWQWVEEYLHSFEKERGKAVSPSAMIILVKELLDFIDKKGFYFEKRFHAIRPDAIFEATRVTALQRLSGCTNHNYLKKVAISENKKMIDQVETETRETEKKAIEKWHQDPNGLQKIGNILDGLKKKGSALSPSPSRGEGLNEVQSPGFKGQDGGENEKSID
jgi:hypothetical protein